MRPHESDADLPSPEEPSLIADDLLEQSLAMSQFGLHPDPGLVDERRADVRHDVLGNANPEASQQTALRPPERPDKETFSKRVLDLLVDQQNPHLKVGLGLIAGILDSDDALLEHMNEKDGVQMVTNVILSYLREHQQEIMEGILPANPFLEEDVKNFVKSYQEHGSDEELAQLYLAQVAHFAYHLVYYNYTPVEVAFLGSHSNYQGSLVLTRFGSLLLASEIGPGTIQAQYLRIAKRDEPEADSAKPVKVFNGIWDGIFTATSNIPVSVSPHSIGGYRDFSPARICGVKQGRIHPREAAHATEAMTSVTTSVRGLIH